jgi:hypothetical protein
MTGAEMSTKMSDSEMIRRERRPAMELSVPIWAIFRAKSRAVSTLPGEVIAI